MRDGRVLPPETPGLGIRLSPEVRERYPFVPGSGEFNPVPGKPLTDVGYPGLERQAPNAPRPSPKVAAERHPVAPDGERGELRSQVQGHGTRDREPDPAQGESRPGTDLLGREPHDEPSDRHHPPVQGREQADHPAAQTRR